MTYIDIIKFYILFNGKMKIEKNQLIWMIKASVQMKEPSKRDFLTHLYNLKKNYSLSDYEFFDVIGEAYQLNPKFFRLSLYREIRKKLNRIYGDEELCNLDKYLLEKFCFYEREHILYECMASISQDFPKMYNIKVNSAYIIVTNRRIIAQGNLFVSPHYSPGRDWLVALELANDPKEKREGGYILNSEDCYGYIFPTLGLSNLIKLHDGEEINYLNENSRIIVILPKKEVGEQLFKILEKFQT